MSAFTRLGSGLLFLCVVVFAIGLFQLRAVNDLRRGNRAIQVHVDVAKQEPPALTKARTLQVDGQKLNCAFKHSSDDQAPYVVVRPTSSSDRPAAERRVLVLFHGCSHSSPDFCPTSEQCPKCRELPAEVAWVKLGVEWGMTVVAVSSRDRSSGCWHGAKDVARVEAVLADEGLASAPFVAMGASSGGQFAMHFAEEHARTATCIGVIAQVAAPHVPASLHAPVVWSVMARDKASVAAAKAAQKAAAKAKKPVSTYLVIHEPRPVDDVLQEHGYCVSVQKAVKEELEQAAFVDSAGMLQKDPRKSSWRTAVEPVKRQTKELASDTLKADKSRLSEVLNIAFARHEFTSERAREMMCFVDEREDICTSLPTKAKAADSSRD